VNRRCTESSSSSGARSMSTTTMPSVAQVS
jgi:hypothetical protein